MTGAPKEITLDPTDWDDFSRLAHEALDDALQFIRTVRERPVWQPVPEASKASLKEPLPIEGMPIEAVYEQFKELILPNPTGNIHPRFFGWVHGTGQPGNLVADLMVSAMNSNCGGRDHGAAYVEQEVIAWCKELFEFPAESQGILVSGTSMANLTGLCVARNAYWDDTRSKGFDAEHARLTLYASTEAHESVVKALEVLGLGSSSLRKIRVNDDFSIDLSALRSAIARDRAQGHRPFCCIGSAGTTNAGGIDDLCQLADICRDEGMWFHVDGAFGGLCVTSESLRPRVKGMERADSLAFDFHKWAHVQYDAACILVRDAAAYRKTFSMRPPYLEHLQQGLGGGADWPCDYGVELSRCFRALKVWFALKEHGTRQIGLLIEQNCAQARYLATRVAREPELELLAPANLNIVCFRCVKPDLDEAALDELNRKIVVTVQMSGVAAPSSTRIKGKLAIRVNITNHRTRTSDLDVLVDAVLTALRSV